jgi:hypothetical protein
VAQALPDRSQPAALGAVAQQDLGHGQAEKLAVGQPGTSAWSAAGFQQLVDGDVPCDDEVVETGAHEASLEVDVAFATPTLGGLVTLVTLTTLNPIRHQSSSRLSEHTALHNRPRQPPPHPTTTPQGSSSERISRSPTGHYSGWSRRDLNIDSLRFRTGGVRRNTGQAGLSCLG